MKKKTVIVLAAFSVTALFLSMISFGRNDPITEYNRLQEDTFYSIDKDDSEKDMFIGKDISITKGEFLQARNIFLANGNSKEESIRAAEKEIKEYNALCAEARKKGYQVTDEEIDRYLGELKKMIETAENAEDVKRYIKTYGSEDAFWAEMKIVYRKRRPAELYVKDLEEDFAQKNGLDPWSEEFLEKWSKEFEKIKADAVKKQDFRLADSAATE